MRARDRGQAALLVLMVVTVLFAATSAAAVEVGRNVLDRTRAQSAADAAALGGLDGGRPAALELAARHHATLVSFVSGPGPHEVQVVVRVGAASVTARATDLPEP